MDEEQIKPLPEIVPLPDLPAEPAPLVPLSPHRPKRGYWKIFFVTLFIALLMQSFCFFYFQTRKISGVLSENFKIVVALTSVTPERVNEIGNAFSADTDVLGVKFISADDGFEIIKKQNPRMAANFVFLGRKPMTDYFELTVGGAALSDIDAWVKSNISQIPEARAFYKKDAAAAAVYAAQMLTFFNLIAAALLVALFAFIFFVEWADAKPEHARLPAVFTGLLAYGVSYGIFWFLLEPLQAAGGGFFVFTVAEVQCLMAFVAAVLGWVFAKWKRF